LSISVFKYWCSYVTVSFTDHATSLKKMEQFPKVKGASQLSEVLFLGTLQFHVTQKLSLMRNVFFISKKLDCNFALHICRFEAI